MLATLLAVGGPDTVALTPVTKAGLADWLAGQTPAVASWVKAVGFTGEAGSTVFLPGPDGAVARGAGRRVRPGRSVGLRRAAGLAAGRILPDRQQNRGGAGRAGGDAGGAGLGARQLPLQPLQEAAREGLRLPRLAGGGRPWRGRAGGDRNPSGARPGEHPRLRPRPGRAGPGGAGSGGRVRRGGRGDRRPGSARPRLSGDPCGRPCQPARPPADRPALGQPGASEGHHRRQGRLLRHRRARP